MIVTTVKCEIVLKRQEIDIKTNKELRGYYEIRTLKNLSLQKNL